MIDKLHTIITRYDELADLMSQPDAMQDMKAFTKLAREHSGLTELVEHSKKYIYTYEQLQEDEEILNGDDPELKELVKDEIGPLKEDITKQEENTYQTVGIFQEAAPIEYYRSNYRDSQARRS